MRLDVKSYSKLNIDWSFHCKYTTFEQRLSSFSGIILGEFLDNHRKCFVEFPSAKIQY